MLPIATIRTIAVGCVQSNWHEVQRALIGFIIRRETGGRLQLPFCENADCHNAWRAVATPDPAGRAGPSSRGMYGQDDAGRPNLVARANATRQAVAARLAYHALNQVYQLSDIEASGPLPTEFKVEGHAIRIRFCHATRGLCSKGGKLRGFALAGEDRKFHWAEATIEGDAVLVRSRLVPDPIAVRYAWSNNPAGNLYDAAGLPASPFRSDDWPRFTR